MSILQIGLVRRLKCIHSLINVDKVLKKHFCSWEDDTMHACKYFYLHCGLLAKVNCILKTKICR